MVFPAACPGANPWACHMVLGLRSSPNNKEVPEVQDSLMFPNLHTQDPMMFPAHNMAVLETGGSLPNQGTTRDQNTQKSPNYTQCWKCHDKLSARN